MDYQSLRLLWVRHVVVTLARTLGFRPCLATARWLARGVFELNTPARRRATDHLIQAFGDTLTDRQRDRLVRDVFENIAAFWVETCWVPRCLRPSSWRRAVRFDDPSMVESVARSDRGALWVSAYFGNMAVTAYALAQVCRPLYVLIDEARHPVLRSWQAELYSQPNIVPLAKQRTRGRVADLLASGAKVFIVGEHVRSGGRAVETRFLGAPWRCYPTVGLLARWCDVPVVVAMGRRQPGRFRFHIATERVAEPRDLGDAPDATDQIVRATMAALEREILSRPEQYLWTRIRDERDLTASTSEANGEGA